MYSDRTATTLLAQATRTQRSIFDAHIAAVVRGNSARADRTRRLLRSAARRTNRRMVSRNATTGFDAFVRAMDAVDMRSN